MFQPRSRPDLSVRRACRETFSLKFFIVTRVVSYYLRSSVLPINRQKKVFRTPWFPLDRAVLTAFAVMCNMKFVAACGNYGATQGFWGLALINSGTGSVQLIDGGGRIAAALNVTIPVPNEANRGLESVATLNVIGFGCRTALCTDDIACANPVPQLWKCNPETSGDASECAAPDWSIVAAGGAFADISNRGDVDNRQVSLLVSHGGRL